MPVMGMLRSAWGLREILEATGGRLVAGAIDDGAVTGASIDSRTLRPGDAFFAIQGPRFDGHDFVLDAAKRGASLAFVHRDVSAVAGLAVVRVADTRRALQDLACRVRLAASVPVVGVTGSMGKTTTKDMAAALLESRGPVLKSEGNLNNEYGLPLSLLRLNEAHWAAVLEMGMSAAGELRALTRIAQPDVAVIANVAPVHLEFFPSVEAIADAKAEILEGLRPGGVAVLNGDDPLVRRIGERHGGRIVWFGTGRGFDVCGDNDRAIPTGVRFDLRVGGTIVDVTLPFAGSHFMANFLAAAAAAHALGVAPAAMARVAAELRPASHRGQIVRLRNDVTLLDDCYNSNPRALDAAVTALGLQAGARHVAFLGDMLELGADAAAIHRDAGRRLAERLDAIVGVGPLARQLVDGARDARGTAVEIHHFADSAAAAHAASTLVRHGDAVLVKGSRGIRLEAVVNALVAQLGKAEV